MTHDLAISFDAAVEVRRAINQLHAKQTLSHEEFKQLRHYWREWQQYPVKVRIAVLEYLMAPGPPAA